MEFPQIDPKLFEQFKDKKPLEILYMLRNTINEAIEEVKAYEQSNHSNSCKGGKQRD